MVIEEFGKVAVFWVSPSEPHSSSSPIRASAAANGTHTDV